MSQLGSAIRSQSELIHHDHQLLTERLAALDAALEGIVCHAEVFADLARSADVITAGKWLCAWLPEHFVQEEQTLAEVAKLGPEWLAFAAEMARQHADICGRLHRFCRIAAELEHAIDLESSICDLKQSGQDLTRFMVAHMGAEERKLRTLNA